MLALWLHKGLEMVAICWMLCIRPWLSVFVYKLGSECFHGIWVHQQIGDLVASTNLLQQLSDSLSLRKVN
jgi:hypothetical protein